VFRITVNFIVLAVCKDKELVNTSIPQERCTAVVAVLQPCTLISFYLFDANVPRWHFNPQGMRLYFTTSDTYLYIYIYIYNST